MPVSAAWDRSSAAPRSPRTPCHPSDDGSPDSVSSDSTQESGQDGLLPPGGVGSRAPRAGRSHHSVAERWDALRALGVRVLAPARPSGALRASS